MKKLLSTLVLYALILNCTAFDEVIGIIPDTRKSPLPAGKYGKKVEFKYLNLGMQSFDKKSKIEIDKEKEYLALFQKFVKGCYSSDYDLLGSIAPEGFYSSDMAKKQITYLAENERFILHGVARIGDDCFFIACSEKEGKYMPLCFGIDESSFKMKTVTFPKEYSGISLLLTYSGANDLPLALKN